MYVIENNDSTLLDLSDTQKEKYLVGHVEKYSDLTTSNGFDMRFAIFDFSNYVGGFSSKTLFCSLDSIPICTKYPTPKMVTFFQGEKQHDGEVMVPLKASVDKLFSHFCGPFFLELDASRFDKVKRAVTHQNTIEMPRIINSAGNLTFDNGRHRLVALAKYGFDQIYVNVPKSTFSLCQEIFGAGSFS